MKFTKYIIIALFAVASTGLIAAESAHHGKGHHGQESGHHMGGHGDHKMKGHKPSHGKKKAPVHLFTSHWAKTLTEKQKLDIDAMHLKVGQFEAVQKAKAKLLKAELSVIAANTPVDKKSMYAKIDEIIDVKKSIMRNRYDHIAEMREVLTKEQRLSYDAGLLKSKKQKH